MTDKLLIKKRFSKSINTYNKNAPVQKKMAENLVNFVKPISDTSFGKVLDLGCGTGMVSQYMLENFKIHELIANDISRDFYLCSAKLAEKFSDTKISFFQADLEDTFLFDNDNDLIISGAAFQWINDKEKLFSGLKNIIKPGGIIAFSTFGTQNFCEIKEITSNSLKYCSFDDTLSALSKNFEIMHASQEIVKLLFENPIEILKHLKYTGVNGVSNQLWTKNKLNLFSESYKKLFSQNSKLSLTYHPMYFIVKLK